jgi:type I restriction enzyme S subunit
MTQLPDGWEIKRLDEIADIVMGQSPPGSSYNEHGEGQPFFQGKTEFGEVHPTVRKYTTAGTKFAKAGDILMSVRAPVGPTNIADIDCVIGRGLAAIRAKTVVSQDYLRWSLKHLEIDIQSKGTGTTFDAITGETLRGTLVALPPIDQQHKIVELLEDHLSRLDAALDDVKQAKIKAAQFRRSLLQAAFTGNLGLGESSLIAELPPHWSSLALGELCSAVEKVDPANLGRDDFWYLDIGALEPSSSSLDKVINIPTANAPGRARQLIRNGDSIFATVRPYMKKVAYIPKEFDGQIASTGFCVLRPIQEKLHSKYLFYFLLSDQLLDQVLPLQRGVSYPAIRDNDLKKAHIPIPPIDEQNKIVELLEDHLSRLDASVSLAEAMEKQSNGLRRSLLQAAFTGQLKKEVASV